MITVGLFILAPSIVSSPGGVNYLAYQRTVIERTTDDEHSFDDECNGELVVTSSKERRMLNSSFFH